MGEGLMSRVRGRLGMILHADHIIDVEAGLIFLGKGRLKVLRYG